MFRIVGRYAKDSATDKLKKALDGVINSDEESESGFNYSGSSSRNSKKFMPSCYDEESTYSVYK